MSLPPLKPGPKNPVLRTPQMNLPPSARGRVALGLTACAAEGRLELQVCDDCGAVQYPPREACHRCVSPHLQWRHQSGEGRLIATTTLTHSNDLYFRELLPWRLGMVHLDAGPSVMVHLHGQVPEPLADAPLPRVRVGVRLDRSSQAVLIGFPEQESAPMDDDKMLRELAAEIGGKVDIVVNTAEYHRGFGIAARRGTDVAKAEMEVNYFGLLRLAQCFGPALRARSADGPAHATAWVNLLSVFALSNFPAQGTFAASKAAALSLSQCLRAEMRPAGIRVVNVFPGPLDEEWNQNLPPPKLAPAALASAIVQALRAGVEDVYPGEVAQ